MSRSVVKMELLAPAGNFECLEAAVQNGADAVYFAGLNFGARSYATNFDMAGIESAAKYCHLRGAKAYVTVNTLALDRELPELISYVSDLVRAGVDAVIVQDLGVMRAIRTVCPELPIHVSTQATVHNLAGVRAMEQLGAKRVVLSRELSAENIRSIAKNTKTELEVFVHGAMCMSYSGQCLMSSVLGGRSGNRGKCAQPCRLPYEGKAGSKFYLSLKDMSLLKHLSELDDIGVASLKIEGRMKGPAYVAAVVRAYRRCIDEKRMPTQAELETLDRIFFRGGLTDAYFCGNKGIDMFAFDKPDNPYLKNSEIDVNHEEYKKRQVKAVLSLKTGRWPKAELYCDGHSVTYIGENVLQPAEKKEITEEVLIGQFTKTGGTPFEIEVADIKIEGRPFCAAKDINALRRGGLLMLEEVLSESIHREIYPPETMPKPNRSVNGEPGMRVSVLSYEQYLAVKEFPFELIYTPMHLLLKSPEKYLAERERIVIMPPVIVHDSEYAKFEEDLKTLHGAGFKSLMVHSNAELKRAEQFTLYGGFRMNVTNSFTLRELESAQIESVALSPELNLAQMRDLEKPLPTEVFAYGRLPLMLTENCILKNLGNCPCSGEGVLKDRKGMSFPVVKDGDNCRSIVLNAVPLYMADKMDDLRSIGAAALRLDFTTESPEQCIKICEEYWSPSSTVRSGEYTRLHFYKGVL